MKIKIEGCFFEPEELGIEILEAGGKIYYDVTKLLVDCGPESSEIWRVAEELNKGMKPEEAKKRAREATLNRIQILQSLERE